MDGDVTVMIDRGQKYCATMAAIVIGVVGSPAKETDSERGSGNNHNRTVLSVLAFENQVSVRRSPSSSGVEHVSPSLWSLVESNILSI